VGGIFSGPGSRENLRNSVRRFETPPGKQAQVDWGHLGSLSEEGAEHMLWVFTITLGYSRMMMAEAVIQAGQAAYFMTAHNLVIDIGRAYREGRLDRRLRV
jgi:transposase